MGIIEEYIRWLQNNEQMTETGIENRMQFLCKLDEILKNQNNNGGVFEASFATIDELINLYGKKGNEENSAAYKMLSKALQSFREFKLSYEYAKINKKSSFPEDLGVEEKKLIKRIEREFKKCRYIGDIRINDEEYAILKKIAKNGYALICERQSHEYIDTAFATSLVQIGIKHYDGRFWEHVAKELNVEKMPANQQGWIGKSFYNTLRKYGKYYVGQSEHMNNILLHCFITEHYADDLFDFLFAYYQIDLDRDLSANSKEMRDYLMQSMKKGETTVRAYKIKKHTSDAASANDKGCRIRVGKILRMMDNALFTGDFPESSENRISKLFCKWAKKSKKFDNEQKMARGLTHKGQKRYSTPYIRFDNGMFNMIFPPQYIHLDTNEELPDLMWKISVDGDIKEIAANTENCVTGCKTERCKNVFPPEKLMKEVNIELWKNGKDRIRSFRIKEDSVRIFDSDWNMIDSATYKNYLPVGSGYAFLCPGEKLISDGCSNIDCERLLGYDLYVLSLKKGDVIRFPNGKAKSVGKPLEEGLLSQSIVCGAFAGIEGGKYTIYSEVPSVYFRMMANQENGTLILINGKRYRFDADKCIRFDIEEKTEEKGYIVKLSELISSPGIYEITVDVPNSRKERNYSFVYLPGFSYRYENAPYIFKEKGKIVFEESSGLHCIGNETTDCCKEYDFDILPEQDYLSFTYDTVEGKIDVHIDIPALKWKFDDGEWNIKKPEEIWHKEFPKMIYIKHPGDEITFSMDPLMTEASDEDDEEYSFSQKFNKLKEKNLFECDTRKILSWLGFDEKLRVLRLETEQQNIAFVSVITRCFVNGKPTIITNGENAASPELIIKSDILGFFDCVADVYCEEKLIAEKQQILSSGIHIKNSFESGNYKIIYYQRDEEDDDFGIEDYRKFEGKTVSFRNPYDLSRKEILITGVTGREKQKTVFEPYKYELSNAITVTNLAPYELNGNSISGNCFIEGQAHKVCITPDDRQTKAKVLYEEDGELCELLYDKIKKELVIHEDKRLNSKQSKERYLFLDEEKYVFNVQIRENGR